MATRLVTPPATFPVTLAEAKTHLNVDFDDHDSLISSMIGAATDYAQKFTGRVFIEQTWALVIDAFPISEIKIPNPPLIGVNSIIYYDAAGNETTLDAAAYTVDNVSEPGWIVPSSSGRSGSSLEFESRWCIEREHSGSAWPTPLNAINAVTIQYRAGYTSGVPSAIKSAILLIVGTLYANRETVVVGQVAAQVPWSAEQLLRPYRIHTAFA